METAIRVSRNSSPGSNQRFLYVDVVGKSFRLCNITSGYKRRVRYDTVYSSTKAPAFRAFDWHPSKEDLVVVGQAGGEATLLNVAEGQQDSLSFNVRSQRLCNAVALNTQNLLAVGLDKVRTDFCLNIWDFNQRLPAPGTKGFSKNYSDPLHRLASGEPITSLKFFHDDPSLFVAGVKGQFVRLYDLREPAVGNGLQFATRCVHNLAIDWLDENYFASCYPMNDPSICVWDRRMITRVNTPHMSFPHNDGRQPELSLELKHTIQGPETIWSLRFSKAQRGCLGVLSSTGNLKVYNLSKDFSESYRSDHNGVQEQSWETNSPQEIHLDRTQDIAKKHSNPSTTHEEPSRIVSFDFMTSTTKSEQPRILILDEYGQVKLISPSPLPTPTTLSSAGNLSKGTSFIQQSPTTPEEPGPAVDKIRLRAQPRNNLRKSFKQTRQSRAAVDTRRMSSLDDQAWHADLGFYEIDVPLSDFLTLTSVQRMRCEAGYLLNASQNKSIVSDSHWLQAFWAWVERAAKISKNGNMAQDNIDLSYLGIYSLWMEDVDMKNRSLGPTSNRLKMVIENLVRRLSIPVLDIDTQYPAHRQLCLHSTGLAWSSDELGVIVRRLVVKNQHTKAAALALFAMDRKLAYKALRNKTANQSHKMLAMAIAGAFKKAKSSDTHTVTEDDSDREDDWAATIASLAEELTDPYARAILAYVRTGEWSNVVAEESLPLKYRVGIALRHYDDSKLTHYIAQATREAVAAGDIEGIILTGTATQASFDLMSNYIQRFGDVQTAVLALCPAVPRYLDDEKIVRKFTTWKDVYRHMMNSWNLKFHRVRFDIASQNVARDEAGRLLITPAKQQIRLVCQYCSQSIAHGAGLSGETSPVRKTVDTPRNPLSKEKAAAIGTVCPKCERHLPRCGVCDMWLGVPDSSYMPWYGVQQTSKYEAGKSSVDLSASITGSIQTTLGPETPGRVVAAKGTGSPRPKSSPQTQSKSSATDSSTRTMVSIFTAADKEIDSTPSVMLERQSSQVVEIDPEEQKVQAAQKWDASMSRFTVLCLKCSHGYHATHARMWFEKHSVCPVPECRCLCNV
jgi:WD repeat-containing protein mio